MRSPLAVGILLVAGLVASIALAAPDRAKVTFESLSASGVGGDATLTAMPSGQVQIHTSLRGLEPSTTYSALIFDASQSCDVATSSAQVVQFTSNPAGIATWNEKIDRDLSTIKSIGIRVVSDNSLVACGVVTP
jgi:hypothetical protein